MCYKFGRGGLRNHANQNHEMDRITVRRDCALDPWFCYPSRHPRLQGCGRVFMPRVALVFGGRRTRRGRLPHHRQCWNSRIPCPDNCSKPKQTRHRQSISDPDSHLGELNVTKPGAFRRGQFDSARDNFAPQAKSLVMQDDIQQGTADFQAPVVVNKSELAKPVHEKAHP